MARILPIIMVGIGSLFGPLRNISSAQNLKVLSLEQVLTEVRSENNEIKALTAEVQTVKAQVEPSASLEDPMLSVSAANYPLSDLDRNRYEMTGNELELRQKLPFPGKLAGLRTEALAQLELASFRMEAKQRELIRAAEKSYIRSAYLHSAHEINQQQISLLSKLASLAESKLALGSTKFDEILALRLKQSELSSESFKLQGEIKLTCAELNHLMGRSDHSYSWKPQELRYRSLDSQALSADRVVPLALKNNAALQSVQADRNLSKAKLASANLSHLPDFELMLRYTQRTDDAGEHRDDFISAGVGISLPLWYETKQKPLQRAANFELVRASHLLREQASHIEHYVHAVLAELEEAEQNLKLYHSKILPYTKQSVDWAESAYASEKTDFSSLLTLINESFEARRKYLESLARREGILADLEELCGRPVTELK